MTEQTLVDEHRFKSYENEDQRYFLGRGSKTKRYIFDEQFFQEYSWQTLGKSLHNPPLNRDTQMHFLCLRRYNLNLWITLNQAQYALGKILFFQCIFEVFKLAMFKTFLFSSIPGFYSIKLLFFRSKTGLPF